jgi:hypothetical protein
MQNTRAYAVSAALVSLIGLGVSGAAAEQFELFSKRSVPSTHNLHSMLTVRYTSTAESVVLRRIELIVFDDGSIAANRTLPLNRCSRLSVDTRRELAASLASAPVQQALKLGRVEGCIATQSLPDPALVINVAGFTSVFSMLSVPATVRDLVGALDRAFAAAECRTAPVAIAPLLHR